MPPLGGRSVEGGVFGRSAGPDEGVFAGEAFARALCRKRSPANRDAVRDLQWFRFRRRQRQRAVPAFTTQQIDDGEMTMSKESIGAPMRIGGANVETNGFAGKWALIQGA